MELRFSIAELNVISNLLLELEDKTPRHNELINKVLVRDFHFDADELEELHRILLDEKHRLHESAKHHGDIDADSDLLTKFNAIERSIERVEEVMATI